MDTSFPTTDAGSSATITTTQLSENQELAIQTHEVEVVKIIYVPKTMMGRIMGENGATIKAIEDMSGARISNKPDSMRSTLLFEVEGSLSKVNHAEQLMYDYLDGVRHTPQSQPYTLFGEGGPDPSKALNRKTIRADRVVFEKKFLGGLFGIKGRNINIITTTTRAQIDVNILPTAAIIEIIGDKSQIKLARSIIAYIQNLMDREGVITEWQIKQFARGVTSVRTNPSIHEIEQIAQREASVMQAVRNDP